MNLAVEKLDSMHFRLRVVARNRRPVDRLWGLVVEPGDIPQASEPFHGQDELLLLARSPAEGSSKCMLAATGGATATDRTGRRRSEDSTSAQPRLTCAKNAAVDCTDC